MDETPESHEEFIRYGTIRSINQGDMEAALDVVSADLTYHRSGEKRGRAALREDLEMWHESFPDVEAAIDGVVSDGDWCTFRYTIRGTHEGEFEGIPPTGETVEAQGIGFARIVDQEIVEYNLVFDGLGLLEQLGVFEEWEGKQ